MHSLINKHPTATPVVAGLVLIGGLLLATNLVAMAGEWIRNLPLQ